MTSHDDTAAGPGRSEPEATGGLEMEKWILRVLLMAMLTVTVAAVVASLDDLKRYLEIRRM